MITDGRDNILLWLPSPLGDAIMAAPAIKAITEIHSDSNIWLYASKTVREVLGPLGQRDNWLEQTTQNPFVLAAEFKRYKFKQAVLFKNSFSSALTVYLAGIDQRVGYSREFRGLFLNKKLYPARAENGDYKHIPMADYYGAIAASLGAPVADSVPSLTFDAGELTMLKSQMPQLFNGTGPMIILVPGGAFGPSKCWPAEYFAQLADRLVEQYKAQVVISVAPNEFEKQIASRIIGKSMNRLVNLANSPMSLARLKALFSQADLVVTNDTGPRHIAIALGRKVITLFGPNDPKWTDTGYSGEIKIVSDARCVPCARPKCKLPQRICMEAITVEQVFNTAQSMLSGAAQK